MREDAQLPVLSRRLLLTCACFFVLIVCLIWSTSFAVSHMGTYGPRYKSLLLLFFSLASLIVLVGVLFKLVIPPGLASKGLVLFKTLLGYQYEERETILIFSTDSMSWIHLKEKYSIFYFQLENELVADAFVRDLKCVIEDQAAADKSNRMVILPYAFSGEMQERLLQSLHFRKVGRVQCLGIMNYITCSVSALITCLAQMLLPRLPDDAGTRLAWKSSQPCSGQAIWILGNNEIQVEPTPFTKWVKGAFIWSLPALLTIYVTMFAITWGQYEFAFDRQHKRFTMVSEMMLTGNYNSSHMLSSMTKKLPKRPTLLDVDYVFESVFKKQISEEYYEHNQDLMDDIAELLRSNVWQGTLKLSDIVLTNTNLDGVNLSNARLWNANFSGSTMSKARFNSTTLSGANFSNCMLKDSVFSGAYMPNVNFSGSMMQGTRFNSLYYGSSSVRQGQAKPTELQGANFDRCFLREASFVGARLDCSSFFKANLTKTEWAGATLLGAYFRGADLDEANLNHAIIGGLGWSESKKLVGDYSYYHHDLSINSDNPSAISKYVQKRFVQRFGKAMNLRTAILPEQFKKGLQEEYPKLFK